MSPRIASGSVRAAHACPGGWCGGESSSRALAEAVSGAAQDTGALHLPFISADYVSPELQLCRFGVGATTDIAAYPIKDLRLGWYTDWTATLKPARPHGTEYLPMVRLAQTGPDSYASSPSGDALLAVIAAQPGALWLIGNEPDRRYYQDSLEPQVYARAYHDLYYLIKGADPSARIAAGGIVQPTPLRLQYLDMVLDAYVDLYGEAMPVDVWNIHAFILRECSSLAPPGSPCYQNSWGADIPPGISAIEGMLYEIQDSDNFEIFKQFIRDFRQWMADRGYRDRPLIITEFGVLMPWYLLSEDQGVADARVVAYMNATFDHLLTTTDAALGYPPDRNRQVQYWAWYSLTDDTYNGWLFDPATKARTRFGDNFAAFTAGVKPQVNVTAVRAWAEPASPVIPGEPVTYTLSAEVVNNGNVRTSTPLAARFYDGDPAQGGQHIGSDQFIEDLAGCARNAVVSERWTTAGGAGAILWVVVDAYDALAESDESDNRLSFAVPAQ